MVALSATIALLIVAETALWLGRGTHRRAALVAGVVAAILAFHALPAGLRMLARRWHVQPPFWPWLPTAGVLILVGAARLLFPAWPGVERATKYRLAFLGLVLTLVTLNLINWCQPGWCERFGFPFPYLWWSDAIPTTETSWTAALADAGVAVAACWLLAHAFRRAEAKVVAARGWDVTTEPLGPAATVRYVEGVNRIEFWFEPSGGSSVEGILCIPQAANWDQTYSRARGRRQEIVDRVVSAVIQREYPAHFAQPDPNDENVILIRGRGHDDEECSPRRITPYPCRLQRLGVSRSIPFPGVDVSRRSGPHPRRGASRLPALAHRHHVGVGAALSFLPSRAFRHPVHGRGG